MRKFLFIFIAILAYLLLCSKSCDSDERDDAVSQEAELTKTKERIKNEFKSEDLSKKSLRAFEVKAKQKLIDLADYLSIYYDKPIDKSFKNQARLMIQDLFISDSVQINSLLLNESEAKNIPINKYFSSGFGSGFNSMVFTFDSIEVTTPLRRIDDFNYKGRLSFSQHVKTCSSADTVFTVPVRMEADIFASKVRKPFGKDTLQVWSVFLGEIK